MIDLFFAWALMIFAWIIMINDQTKALALFAMSGVFFCYHEIANINKRLGGGSRR